MLFRNFFTCLPFLVAPAVSFADAARFSTPAWCCPNQCQLDEGEAMLLPREDGSGEFDLMLNDVRVPVMPGAHYGASQSGQMRYCVGYDPFGNRQIKCLFVSPAA